MPTPIDNAKKKLAMLRAEIARIEQFISDYHVFSAGIDGDRADTRRTPLQGNLSTDDFPVDKRIEARRLGGPTPRDLAEMMERLIRDVGRPMTRGEIVEALELKDIVIPAQDKHRYIGTIAWRNKALFLNVHGRGYWLRGERPDKSVGGMATLAIDQPTEQSDKLSDA